MDGLSRVYLTSHGSRRPQATGTPGQRRPVTVSSPHRQTDLCTSALCFGVSYTKLLSSHMRHPPDSNPGALARAPIHEQALNRVSHRGALVTIRCRIEKLSHFLYTLTWSFT
jgi:hypothetical protein